MAYYPLPTVTLDAAGRLDAPAYLAQLPRGWRDALGDVVVATATEVDPVWAAPALNDGLNRLSWLVARTRRNPQGFVRRHHSDELDALVASAWEFALNDDPIAPELVRALVVAGWRNSAWEAAHRNGVSDFLMRDMLRLTTARLAGVWAGDRPLCAMGDDPFAEPLATYPAAVAALRALSQAVRAAGAAGSPVAVTYEAPPATDPVPLVGDVDLGFIPELLQAATELQAGGQPATRVVVARGLRDLGRPFELGASLLQATMFRGQELIAPNYTIAPGRVAVAWPLVAPRSGGIDSSVPDPAGDAMRGLGRRR